MSLTSSLHFLLLGAVSTLALTGLPDTAHANPTGGTVVGGSATITSTPSELQINQSSHKALIEWNSFDIAAGETTHFYQPSTSSVALNRVVNSTQLSTLDGNLLANGQVMVINPNGVLIGSHGRVDTAGFIASTADMSNQAFMNATNAHDFNIAGHSDASVENRGLITVREEGLAALVAPHVRNSGVIEGDVAKVHLAAGDTFGVDLYGDSLFYLALAPAGDARQIDVENSGSIMTPGGKVRMSAAAASNLVASSINNSSIVEARGMTTHNGQIVLIGDGATVSNTGKLTASTANGGGAVRMVGRNISSSGTINAESANSGKGGHIELFGDETTRISGTVKASGIDGGGNIEVRGDDIIVETPAYMVAEATGSGKGGHIDLFGHASTTIDGIVKATGATDGGNIEARGDKVAVTGTAVAEGATGNGGHIDLVGGAQTTVDGTLKAAGNTGGGHIKVSGEVVETGASSVLKTKDGSIRLAGNTRATLNGGLFGADHTVISAPTVDIAGDVRLLNGTFNLTADTVNLDGLVQDINHQAITDPLHFTSSAAAVNILSDDALVQQGIYLAGTNALVTVSGGDYLDGFTIDRALTLQGDGSSPLLRTAAPQGAVITIAADDVTVKGFRISGNGATTGIKLTGNNDITIEDNTIENHATGLDASLFGNGAVTLAGNLFQNNDYGARFGSGTVDLTGTGNTFNGGTTALLFQRAMSGAQPAALSLRGDTLGASAFNAQSGFHVDLRNGAFFAPGNPTLLDGTQATFDGLNGSTLTTGQLQNVETRLHDFDDDHTLGQIFQSAAPAPPGLNTTFVQVEPLGRPIVSVADQAIVYNPPFEPVETLALHTDVSIKLRTPPTPAETTTDAGALANIAPAAGGDMEEYLRKKRSKTAQELAAIEPAAGDTAQNRDITCANDFLDNKPCEAQ